MSDIRAVIQQDGVVPTGNLQFVGRNGAYLDALHFLDRLDFDVVSGRQGHPHHLRGLGFFRVRLGFFLLNHFSIGMLCQVHGKLHFIDIRIAREGRHLLFLVVPLHAAGLEHQPILDGGVEDHETVVLLVENIVAGIGNLFRAFLVLRPDRLEDDGFVAAGEDFHQIRKHAFHGIENIRSDDRAAALFFVAVGFAHVGTGGLCPVFGNLAIRMAECGLGFLVEDSQQVGFGHLHKRPYVTRRFLYWIC